MPMYCFKNEKGQIKEFFYPMKDVPSVGTEIEVEGVKWKRIFTNPNAAFGMQPIDPYSAKAFATKTGQMKGTLGDLYDLSREMSEKRAQKEGVDPVKENYYKNYSKKRKGHTHFSQKKEKHNKAIKEANKKLEKHGISIGLT